MNVYSVLLAGFKKQEFKELVFGYEFLSGILFQTCQYNSLSDVTNTISQLS